MDTGPGASKKGKQNKTHYGDNNALKRAENPKLFFPESCRENNFSNESNEDETLPAGQLVIFPPLSASLPPFSTHFKPPSPLTKLVLHTQPSHNEAKVFMKVIFKFFISLRLSRDTYSQNFHRNRRLKSLEKYFREILRGIRISMRL